jgi:hypothetical protein
MMQGIGDVASTAVYQYNKPPAQQRPQYGRVENYDLGPAGEDYGDPRFGRKKTGGL